MYNHYLGKRKGIKEITKKPYHELFGDIFGEENFTGERKPKLFLAKTMQSVILIKTCIVFYEKTRKN